MSKDLTCGCLSKCAANDDSRQTPTGNRAQSRQRVAGHKKRTVWDDGKNGIRNSNKLDTRPCGKLSGLDPWGFSRCATVWVNLKTCDKKIQFFSAAWALLVNVSCQCIVLHTHVCISVCVRVSSSAQRASPYFLAISIRQTNSPLGTANGCQEGTRESWLAMMWLSVSQCFTSLPFVMLL